MADAEVRVSWRVGPHKFVAVVVVERGLMTLRLELPTAFLESATDEQRRLYGETRDQALDSLATIVADLQDGHEAEHTHHVH